MTTSLNKNFGSAEPEHRNTINTADKFHLNKSLKHINHLIFIHRHFYQNNPKFILGTKNLEKFEVLTHGPFISCGTVIRYVYSHVRFPTGYLGKCDLGLTNY